MTAPADRIRIIVDLPFAVVEQLSKLAAHQGVSVTEALRRSISTEAAIQRWRRTGSKVLLEQKGALSELVFER